MKPISFVLTFWPPPPTQPDDSLSLSLSASLSLSLYFLFLSYSYTFSLSSLTSLPHLTHHSLLNHHAFHKPRTAYFQWCGQPWVLCWGRGCPESDAPSQSHLWCPVSTHTCRSRSHRQEGLEKNRIIPCLGILVEWDWRLTNCSVVIIVPVTSPVMSSISPQTSEQQVSQEYKHLFFLFYATWPELWGSQFWWHFCTWLFSHCAGSHISN